MQSGFVWQFLFRPIPPTFRYAMIDSVPASGYTVSVGITGEGHRMGKRATTPSRRRTGRQGESKTVNLCDQLRAAFQTSGWTFYKLGKLAGVKPETVGRFVRRERDVRAETFAKLATALGL